MSDNFLPYGRQVVEDDDIAEVVRVLRSDYLTTGPEVPAFEAAFARVTNARHAIACSNGTAALHLVALAIGLGPGTAAIVPTLTFLATANAIQMSGGAVVFADVDPETGLMTPETLREALMRAALPVRAVFVVHLGGQTCDMPAIARIAAEAGAVVVEDACHALGSTYTSAGRSHPVGACRHSVASTFSLHPVKTIAAGEGGVITTNDAGLAARMAELRNHGMVRDPSRFKNRGIAIDSRGEPNGWYYEMPEPGLNYRLTDFQAALARNQLGKLDRFAARRRDIAQQYNQRLPSLAPRLRPVTRVAGCNPVLHLYQVRVDFGAIGLDRNTLMARLRDQGIGTQVHYIPVHRQPFYASLNSGLSLPGSDEFYSATLSLPLFASMSIDDADRVVAALARSLHP